MTETDSFRDAALAFIDLVELITPTQWTAPGLGTWTVRDLVGHTARAIVTVEHYLSNAAPPTANVPSAETYYLRMFENTTNDAVAARGIEAGRMIGENPVGTLTSSLGRANAMLDSQPATRIVGVGSLAIPLPEYLRTRVFELVVHGLDVAKATGQKLEVPASVLADTAALAARVAALRGDGPEVLFALTGRRRLSDGFSIFS